jgi:hypothetical protein
MQGGQENTPVRIQDPLRFVVLIELEEKLPRELL